MLEALLRIQAEQIGRITMSDVLRDLVVTELERRLEERREEAGQRGG